MKKITGFFKKFRLRAKYISLLVFTGLIFHTTILAQQRKLIYDVIRNGNIIGNIIFTEFIKEQRKFLSFNSNIKTSFIFSFSDETTETTTFENEIMVRSSFNQKQTGPGKTNTVVEGSGNVYKVIDGNISKIIYASPIYYSTLLLYIKPPENIYKVYSQKFQKLLDIKKVTENKFRLTLPDGNHNYYTYKNGVCSKVDIEQTFFTVQFVLREK
jgi:hypothetical protein